MGKKGGGGNEAAQARADEQERQARIRAGTTRINRIFDDPGEGVGKIDETAVYDPNKDYFHADGVKWTRPGGAADETEFAKFRGEGLFEDRKDKSSFGETFFDGQRQAFIDYATPQLDDQYADANKQLTFSLARAGLLDSSVRADKSAELQKKYDLNKQQIGDQALTYSTEARNNVEKARSDLVTMLNATGDAEGAANSAIARSQALSKPQAFSPLTQLFADFTSGLGTQAAYERADALGGTGVGQPKIGRYNTGLFGNTKSVVVG